jgi:hypothetical protein
VKKTREEEIGSEEDNSFGMTTPKSSDLEDVWSLITHI